MYKWVLILCLVLQSQLAVSQVTTSGRQPGTILPSSLLSLPGGGYMGVEKKLDNAKSRSWNALRTTITVFLLDKNWKKIKEISLANGGNVFSAYYSTLKQVGGKYWFIYLEAGDNSDIGDIKAIDIDPETLETQDAKTIAAGASINQTIKQASQVQDLKIVFKSSPSQKYSYIFVRTFKGTFFLSCLNEKLDAVWGRKEAIDELDDDDIHSVEIDNAGNVFVGYTKKISAYYIIYTITGNTIRRTLNLDKADAKEIMFSTTKDGSVYVVGSYKQDEDYCVGVYKGKMNLTSYEVNGIVKTEFPESLITQLDADNWTLERNKNLGLSPLYTTEVIEATDGGINMVAEFHRLTGMNENYYHAGSIMSVDFGKEVVFSRIPKYSTTGNITSYTANGILSNGPYFHEYSHGDEMIFLYFDNPDNLSRDINKDPKLVNYSNAVLIAATIEANGEVKRQKVDIQSLSDIAISGIDSSSALKIPVIINGQEVVVSLK